MSYNRFQSSANVHNDQPHRSKQTILDFGHDDNSAISVREALLKESGHLTNSERLLDEQYELALKTREDLVNQRWSIKSMQRQYNNIIDKFQGINTLVKKIRLRKRRDTIIVAVVFGLCFGFLIYNLI